MKFRSVTTFNTHDTNAVVGERIEVSHDLPRRCELALRRVIKAGREGTSIEAITSSINKDRNALYSESDIRYALKRLCKEGIVKQRGRNDFYANEKALGVWRELEKEWI